LELRYSMYSLGFSSHSVNRMPSRKVFVSGYILL